MRPPRAKSTRNLALAALLVLGAILVAHCHQQSDETKQQDPGPSRVEPSETPPVTSTLGSLIKSDPEPGGLEDAGARDVSARSTTVKKELAPTTEAPATPATTTARLEAASGSPPAPGQLEGLLPAGVGGRVGELLAPSPELSKTLSETLAQLPASAYNRAEYQPGANSSDAQVDALLPKGTSLFQKDALDPTQLAQMDCHLRNIDYCVAGVLGTAQKMLPESEAELESRCDEMKVTTSCLAVYNKRCSTFKIFSLLAPFSQAPAELRNSPLLSATQRQVVGDLSGAVALPPEVLPPGGKKSKNSTGKPPSLANLMELCQPEARGSPATRDLRERLFNLARCINARVPKLTPCLDDLKAAAQVYYEPRRVLPMRPTCCAVARFRACSIGAMDGVCGLSSFEQLVQSLGGGQESGGLGGAGPFAMLKAIDRVCRQATDYKSAYCREVLPPPGMRTPARRGNKASKLAKALDLISFAPVAQDLSAGL